MKRNLLSLACVLALMIVGSSFSNRNVHEQEKKAAVMYNYIWFLDPDYTAPTGSEGTVNQELARLRSIYSSYVFTSAPSMGLHEYEWGYFPNQIPAIIYSNMP